MTSTLRAKSAIGLFLVALLGCQSASPPQSFVLVAWPPAETLPGDPADGPALVVDPITLPDYLDRSQIVTRQNPVQLSFVPAARWGADLAENTTRVLTENLATRLPSFRVESLRSASPRDGLRLRVEVQAFEVRTDGAVHLEARWSLRRADSREASLQRRASIRVAVAGEGANAKVSAMSQAVAELADSIAAAIRPEDGAHHDTRAKAGGRS